MRYAGKTAAPLPVEDYVQLELVSERRHEYVNGQLIAMPGQQDVNNEIAGLICAFFLVRLKPRGYQVYINDIKVAIPENGKYYYPDVFITKEERTEANHYINYQPELIVEVISADSYITDKVDKYIAYATIPSLKYYLIVEPKTGYVTLYSQNGEEKWQAVTYFRETDVIQLPALEMELPLSEVYQKPNL